MNSIKEIQKIAGASGRNPAHVIKEALRATQAESKRDLQSFTRNIYKDQFDALEELVELSGDNSSVVLRRALDLGIAAIKKELDETKG